VRSDPSIQEVILSGEIRSRSTTPRWRARGEALAIPHLHRLRVHTRWPIAVPARVDARCWRGSASRLRPVVVVHCKPRRRDRRRGARGAGRSARAAAVTLLNQSVLLRGVNDSADALCDLSQALHQAGVLPYYLHLLDRVEGAAHFEVGIEEARRLMREVASRLPGYLVPRLAREEAGREAKIVLAPARGTGD
jgi:KamA family protein